MKAIRITFFLAIVAAFFFPSCEKNITLEMPVGESKIVVEGYVFQDSVPFVFLTRNAPFFSTLDSTALQQ